MQSFTNTLLRAALGFSSVSEPDGSRGKEGKMCRVGWSEMVMEYMYIGVRRAERRLPWMPISDAFHRAILSLQDMAMLGGESGRPGLVRSDPVTLLEDDEGWEDDARPRTTLPSPPVPPVAAFRHKPESVVWSSSSSASVSAPSLPAT